MKVNKLNRKKSITYLKKLLTMVTEENRFQFNRIYSFIGADADTIIDLANNLQLTQMIRQTEATIKKNEWNEITSS